MADTPPKENTLALMKELSELCRMQIALLSSHNQISSDGEMSSELLYNDIIGLGKMTRHHTVAFSIGMKPPQDWAVAHGMLQKMLQDVQALMVASGRLASKQRDLWLDEIRWSVLAFFESLLSFSSSFSASSTRQDTLQRTALVLESADNLSNTSPSFLIAFRSAIQKHVDTGSDALLELQEMIEDNSDMEEMDSEENPEDLDATMSQQERERATAVSAILRLVLLLLKRTLKTSFEPTHDMQAIHRQSSLVTERIDDLVITLHPPQTSVDIPKAAQKLLEQCEFIIATIKQLPRDELSSAMKTVSLNNEVDTSKDYEWFDMCLLQIKKGISKIP